MKKSIFMFAFAGLVLAIMPSCQKEKVNAVVTKTVDATLKVNETYTFTLPAQEGDDAYEITTQASHYTVSKVGLDATGANMVYEYTPALDFVGTDQVVITTTEEEHTGEHHGGMCGNKAPHPQGANILHLPHPHHHHHHDAEEQLEITINLTIESSGDVKVVK